MPSTASVTTNRGQFRASYTHPEMRTTFRAPWMHRKHLFDFVAFLLSKGATDLVVEWR